MVPTDFTSNELALATNLLQPPDLLSKNLSLDSSYWCTQKNELWRRPARKAIQTRLAMMRGWCLGIASRETVVATYIAVRAVSRTRPPPPLFGVVRSFYFIHTNYSTL